MTEREREREPNKEAETVPSNKNRVQDRIIR